MHTSRRVVLAASVAAAAVAGVFLGGCGTRGASLPASPSAPVPPTGGTPSPPVVPPTANPSRAAVTIENAFVIVSSIPDSRFVSYGYGVGFLLRETSGQSSATIDRVAIYGPSGSDEIDYATEFFTQPGGSLARSACYDRSDMLRVRANGALDTFYTEAGAKWLSYCGPGTSGNTATPLLHVVVTFKDDNGVVGSVGAPISTVR